MMYLFDSKKRLIVILAHEFNDEIWAEKDKEKNEQRIKKHVGGLNHAAYYTKKFEIYPEFCMSELSNIADEIYDLVMIENESRGDK